MAKLSVLMGVYNERNREHVKMAVDSVLNQTFTDFEFIICDDGSELEFYHWMAEYCKKDSRILLMKNEKNCGLAITLNRCLKQASGRYIARMDADDLSAPERLEKQVSFLDKHGKYAMVGCNAWLINEDGAWGERILPEAPRREDFLRSVPFVHPTIMVRREVLETLGGYDETSQFLRVEDYELFMRMYAAGYRAYNIQEKLFAYREDYRAYKKRKYRYRINECRMRFRGYKMLGILRGNLRYVVKPLVIGLIPIRLMGVVRRKIYGKNMVQWGQRRM